MEFILSPKSATCISALDKERIEALIERNFAEGRALSPEARRVLQRLKTSEHVVDPEDVPRDLVTMNSVVTLADPLSDAQWQITLVYPEEHDPAENSWSVLSPVGSAVFGLRLHEPAEIRRSGRPAQNWLVADLPFQPEMRGWMTL